MGALANSQVLSTAAATLVVINMVLMMMPYYGMDEGYASRIEKGVTIITWAFITEMLIKIVGLGWQG